MTLWAPLIWSPKYKKLPAISMTKWPRLTDTMINMTNMSSMSRWRRRWRSITRTILSINSRCSPIRSFTSQPCPKLYSSLRSSRSKTCQPSSNLKLLKVTTTTTPATKKKKTPTTKPHNRSKAPTSTRLKMSKILQINKKLTFQTLTRNLRPESGKKEA